MDPRIEQADHYSQQAAFYEGESRKLREKIAKRSAKNLRDAEHALRDRPTTIHDEHSLARSYGQRDDWLAEYSGGLNVVERRATMYAQMATDLRLQILTSLWVQGIDITGTFGPPPTT